MLNRKYRLIDTKEFQKIYKNGFKAKGDFGMMIFLPNKTTSPTDASPQLKFGIVANKKVGNAVQRQKIKRQVRGIIQEHILADTFKQTNGQFSYILFKRALNQEDYQILKTEIAKQFSQFNLNNLV
jgi:ribonuclease P protein component